MAGQTPWQTQTLMDNFLDQHNHDVISFLQTTRELKYDEFDHTGTVIFLKFHPQGLLLFLILTTSASQPNLGEIAL